MKHKKLDGRKFRRQHSINDYIVDLYCASEKLIVELDGEVHRNPIAEEKDAERDVRVENMEFTVLRFENKMVFENLSAVLEEIKEHFMS